MIGLIPIYNFITIDIKWITRLLFNMNVDIYTSFLSSIEGIKPPKISW